MSHSYRNKRGKNINGEILGRDAFVVSPHTGKIYAEIGGESVGSPGQKDWSKHSAARMRRKGARIVIREGLAEMSEARDEEMAEMSELERLEALYNDCIEDDWIDWSDTEIEPEEDNYDWAFDDSYLYDHIDNSEYNPWS